METKSITGAEVKAHGPLADRLELENKVVKGANRLARELVFYWGLGIFIIVIVGLLLLAFLVSTTALLLSNFLLVYITIWGVSVWLAPKLLGRNTVLQRYLGYLGFEEDFRTRNALKYQNLLAEARAKSYQEMALYDEMATRYETLKADINNLLNSLGNGEKKQNMLTWKQLREAFLSLDSPNRTLDLPDYKGFSAIGLSQQRTILKSFLDRVRIEQNNLDQVALDNKDYNIECYSDHFKKESDELQNIKEQKSFVAAELASL